MGAYDGEEVCELVGSFLLYASSLKYNKTNIGLHRDDGWQFLEILAAHIVRKLKRSFKSSAGSTS